MSGLRERIAGWVRSASDLMASESKTPLVPSQASYAQLEQLAAAGLISQGLGLFTVSVGGAVTVPFRHPVLLRCITLISGVAAQLITEGGLDVVDTETGRRSPARDVLRLLTRSPDGRQSARVFVQQMMHDLLTTSNCIARVERVNGRVTRLVRQSMVDAQVERDRFGRLVFKTQDWDAMPGQRNDLSDYDIVHSAVGSLRPSTAQGGGLYGGDWQYLSIPLLTLMRPAIEVGLSGEQYVREFFQGGANQVPYVVTYEQSLDKDKREDLRTYLRSLKGREPLIMGGTGEDRPAVTPLQPMPQRRDTLDLRLHQDREVARVYGIPAPLVGVETATWGAGIAELGRFGWRFGIKLWVGDLLAGFAHSLLEPGQAFQVDPVELVRGSPEQVAPAVATLVGGPNNPPIISPKEARRMVGFPADVDGELIQPAAPEPSGAGNMGGGEGGNEAKEA